MPDVQDYAKRSVEALEKFVPEMVEIFGPHYMREVPFSDGALTSNNQPSADFVFPATHPAVIIEHKTELKTVKKSQCRQQVESYVMNANWTQKLTGAVLGILTDGSEWWARQFCGGIPVGGWFQADPDGLLGIVGGTSIPIDYEVAYRLKPSETDKPRQVRERRALL